MRCRRREIHGEMPMVGWNPITAKEDVMEEIRDWKRQMLSWWRRRVMQSCASNTTAIRHPKGLCVVARLHDCNADSPWVLLDRVEWQSNAAEMRECEFGERLRTSIRLNPSYVSETRSD
jgi:hypothetical protein